METARLNTIESILKVARAGAEKHRRQAEAFKSLAKTLSGERELWALELSMLTAQLELPAKQIKEVDQRLRLSVRKHPKAAKITAMPGIGAVTAATVVGEALPLVRVSSEVSMNGAGGGGYGGHGGQGAAGGASGGSTYGDFANLNQLGSGGGATGTIPGANAYGAAGGGAIEVSAVQAVSIQGTIQAQGRVGGDSAGGGGGGRIYLQSTGSIDTSGATSALTAAPAAPVP